MHIDEYLPPALMQFGVSKTGGSTYEYALIGALVAVVCLILILALRIGS
jgi:Flp pilus assembly pilin Flp